MSLHDRDYVREKDFNYRKMEYSSVKQNNNNNNVKVPSNNIEDTRHDSNGIQRLFYFVFFVIGVLIYFKNS